MYMPLSQLLSLLLSRLLLPGSPAARDPVSGAMMLLLLLLPSLPCPRESMMRPNQVSRLLAKALGTQTTRYCGQERSKNRV